MLGCFSRKRRNCTLNARTTGAPEQKAAGTHTNTAMCPFALLSDDLGLTTDPSSLTPATPCPSCCLCPPSIDAHLQQSVVCPPQTRDFSPSWRCWQHFLEHMGGHRVLHGDETPPTVTFCPVPTGLAESPSGDKTASTRKEWSQKRDLIQRIRMCLSACKAAPSASPCHEKHPTTTPLVSHGHVPPTAIPIHPSSPFHSGHS